MRKLTCVMFIVGALLAVTAGALAQTGYTLDWWTIDGGGSTNTSGRYTLSGTSGQADAAVVAGGDYLLSGGLWGGVRVEYHVCLPLALRNHP